MMDNLKTEEKSPLLLYIVEGDTNLSRNNTRANFDAKGRLYGITSGATAVFTDFPNYVNPCWTTALLSSLTFLIMLLMMVAYMGPQANLRFPRCVPSLNLENLDNKTIHLVHDLTNWTPKQLEMVEKIKNEYQNFNIHLVLLQPPSIINKNDATKLPIVIKPTMPTTTFTAIINNNNNASKKLNKTIELKRVKRSIRKNLKRKKRDNAPFEPFFGFGIKSLLDLLLRNTMDNKIAKRSINDTIPTIDLPPTTTTQKPLTLETITSGLIVENITMDQAFANTPLQFTWQKLNPDLKIFAMRVLHLWQYGGLSFKINIDDNERDNIEKFSVAPQISLQKVIENDLTPNNKLLNFIETGKKSFDRLPKDVVTADDEALHIFTKAPCHVFFGEILLKLKHAKEHETPKKIIKKSLRVFCRHSAVGNNYCRNVFKRAEN